MNLRRPRSKLIIPMNAMSDVAFLLLIFIMVVSLINYRKQIQIDYPEVQQSAQEVKTKKNISIWVDKSGSFFIDGLLSSVSDIEQILNQINNDEPETRVLIIADKNTAFKNVNSVINILQNMEYSEVSLIVQDEK
ncbi:MAG: biopolymer transporter ExbD [Spirochaetaceae bacterium]|nr:biopolymer transporter ExbD [Spirochaetaceae bacterium]